MTSGTPQITLYNTLTRTKERFVPLDANNVRMYVCGPTVYDFAHIGNARPVIVFDVLFRLLRHVYGAEHVTYVRNITDVDDKINARALRDFPDLPLNEAIRRVTEKTETQFLSDARALGTLEPTVQPRATDNIAEMQALIGSLLQRGHAYNAAGEVLFDTTSMPDYGQLSGRNLEDNLAGARIAVDAHKKNPADFVLWKQSSDSEPGWDSPWGRGRPGWHIECSAMSERYLGQTFDIHGGGLDLIFPHHENEIAQSRCAHGTHAMANIWMHNGFLQVEGQKMSKSLGNFVTINELLETDKFGGRKWPGEVLRLAMLMTHYREPIDFSVKRLEEARATWLNWRDAVRRFIPEDGQIPASILEALEDDLNTPLAIANLAKAEAKDAVAAGYFMGLISDHDLRYARKARQELKAGIHDAVERAFSSAAADDLAAIGVEASEVGGQVAARLAALNAKDFAKADAIRNELAEQGIALMDYKDEAGQRQTRWEVKR
ncbi:cysteine--tRNA ligase [Devosia sp.]|uniref:cysteine--tRNA ligase n=1 Tax=Devosia sp. TaxID=1871048 RepID=UPI002FCC3A7D